MIRFACDRCGAEAPAGNLQGRPPHWYAFRLSHRDETELAFLCSATCVAILMRATADALEAQGPDGSWATPAPKEGN